MSKYLGLEKFIFIVSLALVVVCSGLLYFDYPIFPNKYLVKINPENQIARLTSAENTIKRKIDAIPHWERVKINTPIYKNDQLFTDEKSSGLVTFDDGNELEVGSSSLFTIASQEGSNTIDFSQGRINVSVKKGESKMVLKSGDSETVVDGESAEIQVKSSGDEESAQIMVLEGTAKTKVGGEMVEVKANEVVLLDKSGKVSEVAQLPLTLEAPKRNRKFFGLSRKVKFQWEFLQTEINSVTLIVATDQNFETEFKTQAVRGTSFTMGNLPPGQYFWQVVTKGDSGRSVASEHRRFSIFASEVPLLVYPADGATIHFQQISDKDTSGFSLDVIWQDPARAPEYTVELSTDPRFQESLEIAKTQDRQATLTVKEGPYYWRVKALDPERPSEMFSKPSAFVVRNIKIPHASSDVFPQPGSAVVLTGLEAQVKFEWPEIEQAKVSVIQISSEPEFTQPIVVVESSSTEHLWQPRLAGQVYWRLKPIDFYGRPTKYSETFELKLKESPPAVIQPANKGILKLPEQFANVVFKWQPRNYGQLYRLQISKASNFGALLFNEVISETEHEWSAPESGKYHWRVLAEDATITDPILPKAAFSFEINPIKALPAPELDEKYHFEIEYENEERAPADSGFVPEIYELLFGMKAYAQAPKHGQTVIRWPETKGAAGYQIEISADIEFKSSLVNEKTIEAEYRWRNIAPGKYYFRIAVFDKFNQISGFSRPAEMVIEQPLVKLIHPEKNQKIEAVAFKWGAQGQQYDIQVADTEQFANKVVDQQVKTEGFTAKDLKPGTYFWRVRVVGSSRWSQVNSFVKIRTLASPALMLPVDNQVIIWDPEKPPEFRFQWQPVDGAKFYRLHLSKDARHQTALNHFDVKGTELKYQPKTKGEFFWAVRSMSADSSNGAISKAQRVLVEERADGREIKIKTVNQRWFLENTDQSEIEISWEKHEKISHYLVEIASDQEFSQIVHSSLNDSDHALVTLPAGDYYWRIFAAQAPPGRVLASLDPAASRYGQSSELRQARASPHPKWLSTVLFGVGSYTGEQESPSGTANVLNGSASGNPRSFGLEVDWWAGMSSDWGIRFEVVNSSDSIEFDDTASQSVKTTDLAQTRVGLWGNYWWPWQKNLTARVMVGVLQQSRYFFVEENSELSPEVLGSTYFSQKGELLWQPGKGQHSVILGGEVGENLEDFSNMAFSADLQYAYHWRNYSFGLKWKGHWQSVKLNLNYSSSNQTGEANTTNTESATYLTFGLALPD